MKSVLLILLASILIGAVSPEPPPEPPPPLCDCDPLDCDPRCPIWD